MQPGLNFFIGANAQGKTSVLEAISVAATLQSFRGAASDDLLMHGEDAGQIICRVGDDVPEGDWESEFRIAFSREGERVKRQALINGKAVRSSSAYLGYRQESYGRAFHAISFNPADHDLVHGDPKIRRQYWNRIIGAEDPKFLDVLKRFQRTLEQRNALLKDIAPNPTLLQGFTERLVELGSEITHRRILWNERVQKKIPTHLATVAPDQENVTLEMTTYVSGNSGQFQGSSLEIIQQIYWQKLSLMREAEFRAQTTLVGPHREDWNLHLGADVLKSRGSQGEIRSALLALKLAEIDLFRETTGIRPVLLVDDFSSELDSRRRGFLLRFLETTDLQVFVTTTEILPLTGEYFWVEKGTLTRRQPEGNVKEPDVVVRSTLDSRPL